MNKINFDTDYHENANYQLGYKIQFKGHFGEDWSYWVSTVEAYINP
jgi:hypothetical protein